MITWFIAFTITIVCVLVAAWLIWPEIKIRKPSKRTRGEDLALARALRERKEVEERHLAHYHQLGVIADLRKEIREYEGLHRAQEQAMRLRVIEDLAYQSDEQRFRRLQLRLGLVKTADDEWAIPGFDRLYHPDIPGHRMIQMNDDFLPGAICRWSEVDARNAHSCYLYPDKAETERIRIISEEMPTPKQTRIREVKCENGRVVQFHMDKPETWPAQLKSVNGVERPALPEPTVDLGTSGTWDTMAEGVEIVPMPTPTQDRAE